MCDYSLEMYQTRPARVGEEYESYRFPTGSIGFISPRDVYVAVCIECDTRLILNDLSRHVQNTYNVHASAEVTFVRREVGPHHDAVRFDDGTILTLQQLGANVQAYVLEGLYIEKEILREPQSAARA